MDLVYIYLSLLHNNYNKMREHKARCHNRICKQILVLGGEVLQLLYTFITFMLRYMFGFITSVIIFTSYCIDTPVQVHLPSIHHAIHQHTSTVELETKAIRRCAKVSIVSYSRPSLMRIVSRTQFHVERPWGQHPFSIVS